MAHHERENIVYLFINYIHFICIFKSLITSLTVIQLLRPKHHILLIIFQVFLCLPFTETILLFFKIYG